MVKVTSWAFADVGDIRGRLIPARRVADVDPVDQEPAFVVTPAVDGKLRGGGARHDVVQVGVDARHDSDHRPVAPSRRDRLEYVVLQRHLAAGTLHVHHRGRAGHRDGLGNGSDLQLGVDLRRERTRQLDAFTFEGIEALQRERDRIGSRPQILDSILAGAVRRRGANFFNQRTARRLHRDPRQHRAGRVLDRSRDDCLSRDDGWNRDDQRQKCRDIDGRPHLLTSQSDGFQGLEQFLRFDGRLPFFMGSRAQRQLAAVRRLSDAP